MWLLALGRPLIRPTAAAAAAPVFARLGGRAAPLPNLGCLAGSVLAQGCRQASVKAQGAYKKRNTKSVPKKLGAKKTGDQFVIPGNIIYKQRGTLWWPGENCIMGRDHTIHAMATGFVKYYRDPRRHPDRKYIGVVFDKADKLPYAPDAIRKRRLGMMQTMTKRVARPTMSASGIPAEVRRVQDGEPDRLLRLREHYAYREDNWRIGKLVETTNIRKTRFRSRKKMFRFRRWMREKKLAYRREIARKLKEEGPDALVKKKKEPLSKKAAKKAAKHQR